jgi:hypothetical protein
VVLAFSKKELISEYNIWTLDSWFSKKIKEPVSSWNNKEPTLNHWFFAFSCMKLACSFELFSKNLKQELYYILELKRKNLQPEVITSPLNT